MTITDCNEAGRLLALLDDSLSTISHNIAIKQVVVSGLESNPDVNLTSHNNSSQSSTSKQLPKSRIRVRRTLPFSCASQRFLKPPLPSPQITHCTSTDPIGNYITAENVLREVGGLHDHNQLQWIEYFAILEPLQSRCISSGKKLVTVMGDIRNADIQVSYYWSTEPIV